MEFVEYSETSKKYDKNICEEDLKEDKNYSYLENIHNDILFMIIDKENEYRYKNIFAYSYKLNEELIIRFYYEGNDNESMYIHAKNEYALDIINRYCKFSKRKDNKYVKILISNEEFNEFLSYFVQLCFTENYLERCCFCDRNLNIFNNKIKCCNERECKKKFFCIPTNNIVILNFNNIEVFDFIFETFSCCFRHNKFEEALKDNKLIMEGVETLSDMRNIVPRNIIDNNKTELYEQISSSENDLELYKKVGNIVYGILKNILSDNYFSMYNLNYEINKIGIKKKELPVILNINYSGIIENNFDKKENILFHGSSMVSWYIILKNGLRNLSNTNLMANGAAYGQGVYLSDSLSFASGYSRNISNYKRAVGVFLLNDDIEKYKKSNNIFVVPDCSKLILKSLLILDGKESYINDIQKYLIQNSLETKVTEVSLNKIKNKRLNKELEMLKKIDYIKNINIIDDKNWEIIIEKKGKEYMFNFIFNNYPSIAPSIILKTKNDKIKSKVVGGENIVDIDIIEPSKWLLTIKLKDIIKNIFDNI